MIEYLYAYGNEDYKYTGEDPGEYVVDSLQLDVEELPDVEKFLITLDHGYDLVKFDNYIPDSNVSFFAGIYKDETTEKYIIISEHKENDYRYYLFDASLSYNTEESLPPTIISTSANWSENDPLKPGFISNRTGAYDVEDEKTITKMGRELDTSGWYPNFTKDSDSAPIDFWYEKRIDGTYLKEELKHAAYMKVSPLDGEEMTLPFTAYLEGAAEMMGLEGDLLAFGGNNELIQQLAGEDFPIHIKPEDERPYMVGFLFTGIPLEEDNMQMGTIMFLDEEIGGYLNIISFDEYTNYTISYDYAAPVALPQKYVPNADWAQYEESGEGYIKNKIGGYKTLQEVDPIIVEFDDREGHTIEEVMAQYPDFIGTNHNFKQEFIDATEIKVLQSTGYEYSIYRQPGVFNYMGYKAVVFGYNENLFGNMRPIIDQLPIKTKTDWMIMIFGGEPLATSSIIRAAYYDDYEEEEVEDIFYDGDTITYVTALPVPYTQAYVPNANWAQNDENGEGYIKNRPGGYSTYAPLTWTSTVNVPSSMSGNPNVANSGSATEQSGFSEGFKEGTKVELKVGNRIFPQTTIKQIPSGLMFGNNVARGGDDTGEPYAVYYNSIGIPQSVYVQYISNSGDSSWITEGAEIIITIATEVPHKIPDKYINLANSDWAEENPSNWSYIKNKPGMYSIGKSKTYITACGNPIDSSTERVSHKGYNSMEEGFKELYVSGNQIQMVVGDKEFAKTTIKEDLNGNLGFGNQVYAGGTDTGEPYYAYIESSDPYSTPDLKVYYIGGKDNSWIYAGALIQITVGNEEAHKIPNKYIPTADWKQSNLLQDGYIKNKPGMYSTYEESELITPIISQITDTTKIINQQSNTSFDMNFHQFFIPGTKVRVKIGDEVQFETTVKESTNGKYMIGNDVAVGGEDNGESYAFYFDSSFSSNCALYGIAGKDTSWLKTRTYFRLETVKEIPHLVPDKYLASNTPTAGQVLTSDGNGGKTWADPSLNGAVKIIATTSGTQPSLNIAQGGPDVTGAASANIGNGNTVSGGQSLAVGTGLTASGQASLAVGGGSRATGSYCLAAGSGVQANAWGAVAFGGGSQANAEKSLAAGDQAFTNGAHSVALGSNVFANGTGSVAIGNGIVASADNQIAIGNYNIEDEDGEYAVIVGNGSNGSRSTALTVDWNGNVESAGNLKIRYNNNELDVGKAINYIEIQLTHDQMYGYASDGKFQITSAQLAQFNYDNPAEKIIFHGTIDNFIVMPVLYLENKALAGDKILSYGSVGTGGSILMPEFNSNNCYITFNSAGTAAVDGWYTCASYLGCPPYPSENGTFILQCVQNGTNRTLSWVPKT